MQTVLNRIRVILAVLVCKCSRAVLRLLHHGGTSLPGKLALRVCPELLRHLGDGIRVILVSGTNGKTTTSRLIEQGLEQGGISCFANRSGANLLAGITAEFAANAAWNGVPKYQAAVIESDEAALKHVVKYLSPAVLVVTNIFRDQLDRYGEVTHTLGNLKTAIEGIPDTVLCLNADDSLVVSLADGAPNPCVFYGIDVPVESGGDDELSDAMYCIRCKQAYQYDYKTYGHLGGFRCPSCGYHRPDTQVSVNEITELTADYSVVQLNIRGEKEEQRLQLPAVYNLYNCVAAATALDAFGLSAQEIRKAMHSANGFGRMEHFALGSGVRMILVKNPAGYTQVLSYLEAMDAPFDLMCCLNDRLADGTDISWIWDVPFERLAGLNGRIGRIYVAGTRWEELWVRLKYAGIDEGKLECVERYSGFVNELEAHPRPLVIVPTYTAMMELRPVLVKKIGGKDFWE